MTFHVHIVAWRIHDFSIDTQHRPPTPTDTTLASTDRVAAAYLATTPSALYIHYIANSVVKSLIQHVQELKLLIAEFRMLALLFDGMTKHGQHSHDYRSFATDTWHNVANHTDEKVQYSEPQGPTQLPERKMLNLLGDRSMASLMLA